MYANKSKKKSYVVGSNHKSFNVVQCRSSALPTTPPRHIRLGDKERVEEIRNPLGLKSEVRIRVQEKKMSKTVDFLKNPR